MWGDTGGMAIMAGCSGIQQGTIKIHSRARVKWLRLPLRQLEKDFFHEPRPSARRLQLSAEPISDTLAVFAEAGPLRWVAGVTPETPACGPRDNRQVGCHRFHAEAPRRVAADQQLQLPLCERALARASCLS